MSKCSSYCDWGLFLYTELLQNKGTHIVFIISDRKLKGLQNCYSQYDEKL